MADVESVAAIWKTVAYALGGVVITLAGTIVTMAKWFANKREEIAKDYKNLMMQLNKSLDRIGDHLRDLYNKDSTDRASRTEFDFTINNHKEK